MPNFEEALKKCGDSSNDYPRVHLWVVGGIRKCSKKYQFPLVTVPESHEHVNLYAGIGDIRDRLVVFLKPAEI